MGIIMLLTFCCPDTLMSLLSLLHAIWLKNTRIIEVRVYAICVSPSQWALTEISTWTVLEMWC